LGSAELRGPVHDGRPSSLSVQLTHQHVGVRSLPPAGVEHEQFKFFGSKIFGVKELLCLLRWLYSPSPSSLSPPSLDVHSLHTVQGDLLIIPCLYPNSFYFLPQIFVRNCVAYPENFPPGRLRPFPLGRLLQNRPFLFDWSQFLGSVSIHSLDAGFYRCVRWFH
jgi:hypothetical protein